MALGFLNIGDGDEENSSPEEFVELDTRPGEEERDVTIRAETLSEFEDVENVQEHLRNDDIVWVSIKQLRNRNMSDLKRAVKRIKKTVQSIDGDMAGVDEDWIVAAPDYAKVARSPEVEQ